MTHLARRVPFACRARGALVALAVSAGLAVAPPALAQYEWTDARGQKVYSDVPPAPSEKVTNLLRRASTVRPAADTAGNPAPGATLAAAGPGASGPEAAAAPSLADREMAFRKRQAEAADAQKKAEEKSQSDARLARACEDSRTNLRGLESGMRMSRVNADGEREVLGEEEREQRVRQLRRDLAERC